MFDLPRPHEQDHENVSKTTHDNSAATATGAIGSLWSFFFFAPCAQALADLGRTM
jgi:hypothetical protein